MFEINEKTQGLLPYFKLNVKWKYNQNIYINSAKFWTYVNKYKILVKTNLKTSPWDFQVEKPSFIVLHFMLLSKNCINWRPLLSR